MVAGGGKEGASELGAFLIVPDILKSMVDLPIDASECLVENKLDSILEEAEGNVDKQIETELSSRESHFRGVSDVVEYFEEVHEDCGLLGDDLVKNLGGGVSVEEDPYNAVHLDPKSWGES